MIVAYYCTKDGFLTKRGECEEKFIDGIAEPGETLYYGHPDPSLKPKEIEHSWSVLRRNNYPDVGIQMDWLWHAMDAGTLPKIEPFYSEILAVKSRFPKPSN